ncbi:MAG: Sua5/YciO/YrdC/YwlC family protein [Treponema sp.]|jgi:tRNA A37 threonylcarbamoyladenosine synthetase subunit TsaC/SUA5/YrdC|nr:Sua5/YciO/YrdC/YwlC family protein [Treponema sp.]
MIEYVISGNIDHRILSRSAALLAEGGLLGLPSDTSWTVACSLQSGEGIKKLRRLSGERDERHFTLLCSDISQFGELCDMDNTRFRLIKRLSPGPYVFILRTLLGTEKALGLRRREAGVHIPGHAVPLAVVDALGCPLYSITAKRTMLSGDEAGPRKAPASQSSPDNRDFFVTGDAKIHKRNRLPGHPGAGEAEGQRFELPPIPEEDLFEGGWELEAIEDLDCILDTGDERPRIFSTILDLTGDEIRLIRPGAGPWPV